MDESTSQYMQGDKLTCPNCGNTEFCIGKDDIWTDGELYADCTHCLCSTLVHILKRKYHKDMKKDFELVGTETATIVLECATCGKTNELVGQFKMSIYYGTMHDKIEPEPEGWRCPDHPEAIVSMLINTVK